MQFKRKRKIDVANIFITGFLTILIIAMLYPMWYALISSFSSSDAVLTGKVMFLPKEFTLESYKLVFDEPMLFSAYSNTILYTTVGTIVNLIFTLLAAYPLSKKRLVGRRWITFFIMLSNWFSAGIIPTYLNFKELGLINNRISIIIGFAMTAFYMVLVRSQFETLPDALEESAFLDGANDFYIFSRIYIPLSLPTLMTIALYYAVRHWNSYFWAMMLLTDKSKVPLQVLLTKMIKGLRGAADSTEMGFIQYSEETVIYATIMISVIPMLILYPFIQRFFVRGITLGAVKG